MYLSDALRFVSSIRRFLIFKNCFIVIYEPALNCLHFTSSPHASGQSYTNRYQCVISLLGCIYAWHVYKYILLLFFFTSSFLCASR